MIKEDNNTALINFTLITDKSLEQYKMIIH